MGLAGTSSKKCFPHASRKPQRSPRKSFLNFAFPASWRFKFFNNTGQSNTEEKHLDSDFRRNDVKMLCIVNKVIQAKAGAFRYPGALLPGVIEQLLS